MSRIGRQPIEIIAGVSATIERERVIIRGPKGEVTVPIHSHVSVAMDGGHLTVTVVRPNAKEDKALWGLTARLLQNAVIGVTRGYERQLEVQGVGYRVEIKGNSLMFVLGYSHPVIFELPAGIAATIEKNIITLRGIDKQIIGEAAARIRLLRKPDAYHGKGIRYVGEIIRLKPGKAAKSGAAAK
ncbi:MAG: 50S ribosomal protein L6 [Candidatus Uhrbacteria bacterium]